jgi:hypothetical protein
MTCNAILLEVDRIQSHTQCLFEYQTQPSKTLISPTSKIFHFNEKTLFTCSFFLVRHGLDAKRLVFILEVK